VHPTDHAAKAIFTTPADDPIGGVNMNALTLEEGVFRIAVATRHFVYLLGKKGEVIWKTPYEPAYPAYSHIFVYFLKATNTFAVWLSPSQEAQRQADGNLPEHVTFLADGQSVRTVEPPNHPSPAVFDLAEKVSSFVVPPLPIALDRCLPPGEALLLPRQVLWFSLAGAVFAIPIGWWLSRRYSFEAAAQLGWGVFLLLFGLPGLLVLLSVQEWPARERCPNCGRLRVVRREECEHCGAVFSPAAPTGTEIFETVAE
jgi:hypothetical protein